MPQPTVGRMVLYYSKNGDGIVSPAVVLRTRDTTNLEVIERWGPSPDGTLSGKGRPAGLVPELPDDTTVDLLVHGLGDGDCADLSRKGCHQNTGHAQRWGVWSAGSVLTTSSSCTSVTWKHRDAANAIAIIVHALSQPLYITSGLMSHGLAVLAHQGVAES